MSRQLDAAGGFDRPDEMTTFNFGILPLRTVVVNGDPWFVGLDACKILRITNHRSSLALLDDDERGVHTVDSPSGLQEYVIISEAGLYSLIMRSRRPEAKAFKRWVTHDVLPSIRKTGSYSAGVPQSFTEALRLALDQQLALDAKNKELEAQSKELAVAVPKAQVFDVLAGLEGDYSVGETAKILCRHPEIEIGRDRLFDHLAAEKWIYRGEDRRWTAYQTAVNAGWLAEKVVTYSKPGCEGPLLSHQIRVRVKGMNELKRRFTQL